MLGRLPSTTRHLVIDMQRLFAEETAWHTPGLAGILPNICRITEAHLDRTLFARFLTPSQPEAAQGRWRTYYRRWADVTTAVIGEEMLDLVAPLARWARSDTLIHKTTYSIFGSPGFHDRMIAEGVDTLVFTGVETDVCVLASLFDAIDLGYHVIAVTDAVASSNGAAHAAVIELVLSRLGEQVDLVDTATLLQLWGKEDHHE